MKYSVDPFVFSLNPQVAFGILIGENLKNTETSPEDEARLRTAERQMRESFSPDQVRSLPNVAFYREMMEKASINPNKYPPSVEAMFKRILKGGNLPVINALVDLCNAVSVEQQITLGAHDLQDIQEDLSVRLSQPGDQFLPFGETAYETVEPGELVFTSGNMVQTRRWIWRQSELGKTTLQSQGLIFQLVGPNLEGGSLHQAMDAIEELVINRFGGSCRRYLVTAQDSEIVF